MVRTERHPLQVKRAAGTVGGRTGSPPLHSSPRVFLECPPRRLHDEVSMRILRWDTSQRRWREERLHAREPHVLDGLARVVPLSGGRYGLLRGETAAGCGITYRRIDCRLEPRPPVRGLGESGRPRG